MSTQEHRTAQDILASAEQSSLLRITTAGSVDDGKSTLLGRLLLDTNNIYEDHLVRVQAEQAAPATSALALANITDGLRAEREQGITIDVAYRYFSTPRRRFILADTPGHEQYTRNMATGASTADLAIILIDAQKGITSQTRRHAFIASLLGVPRFIVAINKMDLVDFSEENFLRIKDSFACFASRLDVNDIDFLPICALEGDNITTTSARMPWYQGEPLLTRLENVWIGADRNMVDFRFPVQYVLRPNATFRGYCGTISSGSIRVGEEIVVLPSLHTSKVQAILGPGGQPLSHAFTPMAVTLQIEDDLDISRGAVLARTHNFPALKFQFEALTVWLNETPLDLTRRYILQHGTQRTRARIEQVLYRIKVDTLEREKNVPIGMNDISRLTLSTTDALPLDSYRDNRAMGNCILIDPDTLQTVGAAMIIERVPEQTLKGNHSASPTVSDKTHLHAEPGRITLQDREQRAGTRARTLWLTGLSGAGKSSLAREAEAQLFAQGRQVYRLDGDNLRFGLNRDLGYSKADRQENIRRVAEVARLFNEAGITVLCSFISPFARDRDDARSIVGKDRFVEVHVATPLKVCEARDPHGLYAKAHQGIIPEFTGISSPYEAPEAPDLTIDTSSITVAEATKRLLDYLFSLES